MNNCCYNESIFFHLQQILQIHSNLPSKLLILLIKRLVKCITNHRIAYFIYQIVFDDTRRRIWVKKYNKWDPLYFLYRFLLYKYSMLRKNHSKMLEIDLKMKHVYEVWTHLVKNYFVLSGENISQTYAVNVFPNICCNSKSLMSNQL